MERRIRGSVTESQQASVPQFWIDAGGTFTDCIVQMSDGTIRRRKILSSGRTRSAVGAESHPTAIVDPSRCADPDGFWRGYDFEMFDARGQSLARSRVVQFDRSTGTLHLDPPLGLDPQPDLPYEVHAGEDAPILAIRYLLGLCLEDPIPSVDVSLGTTRGTNALVTRRGARTALAITRGFGDLPLIGYQNRPHLFVASIRKPSPLAAVVVEIDERMTSDGLVLRSPDSDTVRRQLAALRDGQIESLAICLLHGHAFPRHEEQVATIARDLGFDHISVSSRVAPMMKIVPRADTTTVDAYLNPILRGYLDRLYLTLRGATSPAMGASAARTAGQTPASRSRLRVLTSAGALVQHGAFTGKDSILSGPAGGVVGFARAALAIGISRAIGLDMGGTSTDVSRYDGHFDREYETEKAGVRVVAPMLAIETVAAGGGSVCHFDGVKLSVGPDSAGADPGPACYARGGPLAVTDLNFFLGRIPQLRFPFRLDRDAVQRRLTALCADVSAATGQRYEPYSLAEGLLAIANANMAEAVRSISVAKGMSPREYLLVAFGGAAPQHACAVARELGMPKILNHPDAGVLSAVGIGMADAARHEARGIYLPLEENTRQRAEHVMLELDRHAREELRGEGVPEARMETARFVDVRYRGLDAFLTISMPEDRDIAGAYQREHVRRFGYAQPGRPLEIVAARVEVTGRSDRALPRSARRAPRPAQPYTSTVAYFHGDLQPTDLYLRDRLQPGNIVAGPAIVCESNSTTVVELGWTAEVLSQGELLLVDQAGKCQDKEITAASDPVHLEIVNNRLTSIAEEMGTVLQQTASSVNIKERLDFSCALFNSDGDLVVNAPHIPVHLGSMAETVRYTIARHPGMVRGDVFVSNDPYHGGSHLPDVTVITPVFDRASGRRVFLTASRAHHAEIGGMDPGSMPAHSKNLAQEGVLIRNMKLVSEGALNESELRDVLLNAEFPTRSIDDNLADIRGQIAANQLGATRLLDLVDELELTVLEAYMEHVQAAAEEKLRRALERLDQGTRCFTDHLDDGSPITVSVRIKGDRATFDFTGTGPVVPGNLNANPAIVTAGLMYCLRLLIDEAIPLNEGMLRAVERVLPPCLLAPPAGASPAECPAVAAGNVETSQRVVDVLLGALQIAAASQGTMNNLLFGDDTFGYYETIGGGAGATRDAAGADAVHSHMTNTRITDPEVLERRFPVRLWEFSVRRGSGGAGKHRGGDGIRRRIEFLRELSMSIVSQRRGKYPPYGLHGGQPGACGNNRLDTADGQIQHLPGIVHQRVGVGDVLTIETPGGGGWGAADGTPGDGAG